MPNNLNPKSFNIDPQRGRDAGDGCRIQRSPGVVRELREKYLSGHER